MIHNEHLRKADESYEIRHDDKGNAMHLIIKDGEAVVYPTLHDLVMHNYFGQDRERFYLPEDCLDTLYDSKEYSYYKIKYTTEIYDIILQLFDKKAQDKAKQVFSIMTEPEREMFFNYVDTLYHYEADNKDEISDGLRQLVDFLS